MAIRLQSKVNVVPPGGNYPFGNIKDDDGTDNGTPVDVNTYADFHQFFAKLLSLGGVVGNDLAENSLNGFQYHTALQNIINTSVVGFLQLKGGIDCSGNPNYPAASKGWSYVVTVAGKIGGASGITVAVGDYIIASADNAGGTQGAVGSSWFIVERNLDLATESTPGIAELATQAEANAGADDARIVTPLKFVTKLNLALAEFVDNAISWQPYSSFSASFGGYADGGNVGFKKTARNTVKLRGLISSAGSENTGTVAVQLPVGYRPSVRQVFVVSYGSAVLGPCTIEIATNGNITPGQVGVPYGNPFSSSSSFYLDGVEFEV